MHDMHDMYAGMLHVFLMSNSPLHAIMLREGLQLAVALNNK